MMRLVLLFLLLLLALAEAENANAAPCTPPTPPQVTVDLVEKSKPLDRSLPIKALSKIDKSPAKPGLEGYNYALGLTETQIEARAEGDIEGAPGSSGVCAYATHLTVTVTWSTFVRLAAELTPGTCLDREVQRHEQHHVALARGFMPEVRRRLAEAVNTAMAGGVDAKSFDAAQKTLWKRLSAALNQASNQAYQDLEAQQAKLDTRAEYEKLPAACGRDALQRLLTQRS